MHRTIALLMLCGPITAGAATHTLGIDLGRGSTADLDDDAERLY